ncbi:ribonucleases P/MRP protein subunit POP5 [Peziza echinospora]|nr:ribonucleases P/MRP protein subunit POP5 [Peziza echinospora]
MVRFKSRYLLFNILYPESSSSSSDAPPPPPGHLDFSRASDPSVTPQVLASLIRDNVVMQFGDWGSGMTSSMSVKYFSPQTSTGIVRCSREHHHLVWAALTLIREIHGQPVVLRVVRVSGTIKKAETEGVKRARNEIKLVREMQLQAASSS